MGTNTTKKKRVSKKSKLSWRKHVDIQDVEKFLEEKRLEERLGKPVSEKTDEELFQVDTTPTVKRNLTTKQAKRLRIRQQLPKCYSMLQPHTQVPDPVIKRNRVRTKEERKNELIKRKEESRRHQGIFKAKDLQSFRDRKAYEGKRAGKGKTIEFSAGVWNVEEDTSDQLQSDVWIDNDTKHHTLRGVGKMPKIVPSSISKKNSVLPSVEAPHPGTSYNPSFEDHQELLQSVAERESKIIKNEKHLMRVTKEIFKRVTPAEKESNWLVEMSEGLPNRNDVNDANNEDDAEYKALNPPVQNRKKNLKQRRKIKEQKKFEQERLLTKREKRKVADIYKLKFLKQKLEERDKKSEVIKQKRQTIKENKSKQVKRLSALKFEEEEIDFNMPRDIPGNLRNIKKEGSLLLNRFKSLQKRNILQPTIRRTHKQAKIKRFQKPEHKDDWKTTVAKVKR